MRACRTSGKELEVQMLQPLIAVELRITFFFFVRFVKKGTIEVRTLIYRYFHAQGNCGFEQGVNDCNERDRGEINKGDNRERTNHHCHGHTRLPC